MKIRIAGTEYDFDIERVTNGTIKRMALQSAAAGTTVTMDYLEKQRVRLEELKKDPDVTPLALATDVGYLDMTTAQIFMAKAQAGEQITWSQAEDYPPTALEVVEEVEDEGQAVDPKEEAPALDV